MRSVFKAAPLPLTVTATNDNKILICIGTGSIANILGKVVL